MLKVDTRHEELRPGDVLLLCTDGLSGTLSDAELLETLRNTPRAQAGAELIRLANSRGGRDNVTVVIVEVGAAV